MKREKIVISVSRAFHIYIKTESRRLGMTQSAYMLYMINKVFMTVSINELKQFELYDVNPELVMRYGRSGSKSLYISIPEDLYEKLRSLLDTGVERDTISKVIRLVLMQYMTLRERKEI